MWLIKGFALFVSATCVGAISIEDAKEGPCFAPPVDQNFDLVWLTNTAVWYYPIWSRFEVYRWTTAISGLDEKAVSEDMVERSCQILKLGGDTGATQTAFNGAKKTSFDSSIVDHGVFDWQETRADGTPGYKGRTYVTLSDNDKYYVTVSCWEADNQKSYTVHSTTKTLDNDRKSTIKKHLEELGFNVAKNYFEMGYDNCADLNGSPSNVASGGGSGGGSDCTEKPPLDQNPMNILFNIFRTKIDFVQSLTNQIMRMILPMVSRFIGMFRQNFEQGASG